MTETFDFETLFDSVAYEVNGNNEDWNLAPQVPDIEQTTLSRSRGLNPVVQTFFEGPEKCECCINWVEKQPLEMPESEKERYENAAICIYRRKDHEKKDARVGGLIAMKDDRLVLQSQALVELIRPDLLTSGFLMPKKGEVEFLPPFKELYFSYNKIVQRHEQLMPGTDDWKYLRLLIDVTDSLLTDVATTVSRLHSKRSTDYQHLWALFPKNVIVQWKLMNEDTLSRVVETTFEYLEYKAQVVGPHKKQKSERTELGLRVNFVSVGFDGVNFGSLEHTKLIPCFEGDKLITKLPIYPLGYSLQDGLVDKLYRRGTRLLDLQEMVHCEHEGTAEESLSYESRFVRYNSFLGLFPMLTFIKVTGRVIVDTFQFSLRLPDLHSRTDPMEDHIVRELCAPDSNQMVQSSILSSQSVRNGPSLPRIDYSLDRRPTKAEQQQNRDYFATHRHLLMLMRPFVRGFSLKYNKWFDLDVLKLRDISWVQQPLERLIFDADIKSMLVSFARHHARSLQLDTSIMSSKGVGLPILLSGPPGTGKTLTAEVIAEETRLPLYRVIAGELGSTASSIESSLTEVLELASKWQCIVLIDEVDTFIANRNSRDRTASEIVSIFLRQTEYYRGIIFLTTNLPHNIDVAFRSRCRLHIQYQPLEQDSRAEIWNLNFARAGLYNRSRLSSNKRPIHLNLDQTQQNSIAEWKLSGRDIQNVVQNAVLWAIAEDSDVTFAKLNTSIKLTVPYASKTTFEMGENNDSGILVGSGIRDSDSSEGSRKRQRLSSGNDDDLF